MRPKGRVCRGYSLTTGFIRSRPTTSEHKPFDSEKLMPGQPQHLCVKHYGCPGHSAVVLHGGPGAPGSAAKLAAAQADPLHVLEPWQRWSSNVPLTVDQHVQDAERLVQSHRLSASIYNYCPVADADDSIERFDLKGHLETWQDMVRLQEAGVYPAAFASIMCPVLMLHGAYDPHPGAMIRKSLEAFVPHLEYQEFDQCGHSPWIEKYARDHFLTRARSWLERHLQ
jgi:pimeloyl-ACP methyl ester carboxylesterase